MMMPPHMMMPPPHHPEMPVLYSKDTKLIRDQTGGKVTARVRADPANKTGPKKLQLKWEGHDIDQAVLTKAKELAMHLIEYNHANPGPPGVPTCDADAHQARMKPEYRARPFC